MNTEIIAKIKTRCYELAKDSLVTYGTAVSADEVIKEAEKIEKYIFSEMKL